MEKLKPLLQSPEERRDAIRARVVEGLTESFPVQSRNKIIEVSDVKVDSKDYTSADQKAAILKGDTLFESVKGTVRVRDALTGKTIDEAKNYTLARVPWFTPRHTLVVGGNEYSVSSMVRSKPGVYARKRSNGILEASFNVLGSNNFNVTMDPEKGEPTLEYGSTKVPLYPVLRSAGISHTAIASKWGTALADANQSRLEKRSPQYVDRLYRKVVPAFMQDAQHSTEEKMRLVLERYGNAKMDPEVTAQTLGKAYKNVTPDSLLDASSKILKIFRNPEDVDDRENLDFKSLHSVEDFFKERIQLDAREIGRRAALKIETNPDVKKALTSGAFTPGLVKFITSSDLVSVPTQTNPLELIDNAMRITSLGEGGIGSERAIPMEARMIHPTQIGAIDPVRTPESFRAGVDVRAALAAHRDSKGNIYVPMRDVKTNKVDYMRAGLLSRSTVAFPQQQLRGKIPALVNGKVSVVPSSQVQYQVPHSSMMYGPTSNLIPFMESNQGNRQLMGSKHQTQAISLVDREPPLVQVQSPGGQSFESVFASIVNPHSSVDGTVTKVDKDFIYIQPRTKTASAKSSLVKVPYDTYMPMAAKTYLHHDVTVKPGDKVRPGDILAESNFTKNKTLALGKNLSVAYMPYYGKNSNDAVVISEGAAKKLTSERMYKMVIPRDADMVFDSAKHKTYYGHTYGHDYYSDRDSEGVVKPGAELRSGEPVVFGLRKASLTSDDIMLGRLHKSLVRPFRDASQTWDHDHAGEVIDVVKTPKRIALTIRTQDPMQIGDKLSGRFGNKGVVSEIVPDDQMVKDEAGKPIDVLMTSAGVVSRINPAQIIESAVGKVAEKTGKPIVVENFTGRNNVEWAKKLLKDNKLKDKETVFDPISGKTIPKVFVGRQYIFKMFKSTDTNYSARGVDKYDANMQPTKGGTQSSKSIGKMEFDALIAHNARNVLKESSTIKSQKNDEYWRAIQLGYPTPPPNTSFASDKFFNMLTGAGVRVDRSSTKLSLAPLTDEDVLSTSAGEIKDAKLINAKDLMPEKGGLFDPATTGGLKGTKWSHIRLAEPVVNPIFKDSVRHLLGMTNPQLDETVRSRGAGYLQKELSKIDVDKRLKELYTEAESKKGTTLDSVTKQIKYLKALKSQNLTPDKAYIVNNVPVLPPVFRPVLPGRGGQELIYGDINPLYRDLIYTNNQFKEIKASKKLPEEEKKLRTVLQDSVGAVYGTNEPTTAKSKSRGHKGFLTNIAGKGSPKYGYFHSKILKRPQDISGRGTIVPDTTLGMDEVGLPEDMLWSMYKPFAIKRLVLQGYPALQAREMVEEKHPAAKEVIYREARERPVMINRAPTLHRYNLVGAFPIPVAGKTIRVNPFVEAGMNADYDGDTMMVHAPISAQSVAEVRGMTMSNLLYGDKNRNDLLVAPQMESVMGIAQAAASKATGNVKKYKTQADAMSDYNSGKINLNTRVVIEGMSRGK